MEGRAKVGESDGQDIGVDCEEDVGWFEVRVEDVVCVAVGEGVAQLGCEAEECVWRDEVAVWCGEERGEGERTVVEDEQGAWRAGARAVGDGR